MLPKEKTDAAVAQQPLGDLVLTCGGPQCGQTFEPDPLDFVGGRLRCPQCAGWTFTLVEVLRPAAGGVR